MQHSRGITTLSEDIIHELFLLFAEVDPPIKRNCDNDFSLQLGWVRLTHVCRRWREVGLKIPSLWADIVWAFPSPAAFDEIRARAQDRLFTLDIDVGRRSRNIRLEECDRRLDVAKDLIENAKVIRTGTHLYTDLFHFLLNRPLQSLQSLNILRPGFVHIPIDSKTTHIDAPKLVYAQFESVFPALPNSRSLRVLKLAGEDCLPNPSYGILDILRSLPLLEEFEILSISTSFFPRSDEWSSYSGHPVLLPHLKKAELFGNQIIDLSSFWSHI